MLMCMRNGKCILYFSEKNKNASSNSWCTSTFLTGSNVNGTHNDTHFDGTRDNDFRQVS